MTGFKALQYKAERPVFLEPFLAGDSLELYQRCPSDGLKESPHSNN
jgi:hypothetical protein